MVRNILDYQGNIIGTITLSDSLTEDQVNAILAPYAAVPPSPLQPTLALGEVVKSESSEEISSSSTGFTDLALIAQKPLKGTYLATFTAAIRTSGVNTKGEARLSIDGVVVSNTTRPIQANSEIIGLVTLSTCEVQGSVSIQTKVVLNGAQVIVPQFRLVSGGSVKVLDRSLNLQRIKDDT